MATHIEIRCENMHEESAWKGLECCFSLNRQLLPPSVISDDAHAHVLLSLRRIASEARDAGWVKTRGGWICPFCLQNRPAPAQDSSVGVISNDD